MTRHEATADELPELQPNTPPEEQLRQQRRRVRLREKCRQRKVEDMRTIMHKLQLIQHPDVTFRQQINLAYDQLNAVCFNNRLSPANEMLHWCREAHKYNGCMFGVHGVVVGIVLNADITSLPDMFCILIHEMVHADIEVRQIPVGAESHGRHFKQGVRLAVAKVQQHLHVFQQIIGAKLTLDAKRISQSRFRRQ